jgi:hypothetical protein
MNNEVMSTNTDQPSASTVEKPARNPKERFRDLAIKRVPRVLDDLRLIKNLASDNYEFSEEWARKVVRTIREELDATEAEFEARLARKDAPKRAEFTL